MKTDQTESAPSPDEQAWLDACPNGDARAVTRTVGEVSVRFTVDRRPATSEDTTIEEFVASTPFPSDAVRQAFTYVASYGRDAFILGPTS